MTTRPLWEQTVTWGIADHLRRQGLSESAAYSTAALVTRGLARRDGLQAEMAKFSFRDPTEVTDPAKTSPKLLEALNRFWSRVGDANLSRERNRLQILAIAGMLSGGAADTAAAAALAKDARAIEAVNGKLGADFDSSTPAWSGLLGLGGFSGLRDEVIAAAGANGTAAADAYDDLASTPATRAPLVKKFQTWAKGQGIYPKTVDGTWAEFTEGAFEETVTEAVGRFSTLADAQALAGMANMMLAEAIGALISRDMWLIKAGRVSTTDPTRVEIVLPPVPPQVTVTPVDEEAEAEAVAAEAAAEAAALAAAAAEARAAAEHTVAARTAADVAARAANAAAARAAAARAVADGSTAPASGFPTTAAVAAGLVLLTGLLVVAARRKSRPQEG